MIAKEILEIISKPWCSNQDIMKIANVSATTASKIKQEIEKEFRKKEPNKYIFMGDNLFHDPVDSEPRCAR